MQFPLPETEVARLDSLKLCGILDTPPEQAFDDVTRLAAYICGAPFAWIGFMDANRLWLKSKIGWQTPELPRNASFCAHIILEPDVLIISDAVADERFRRCPLAAESGIRFYAGFPLVSFDGYALGTLCAMDSMPRALTAGQVDALRSLARQVVHLVERRGDFRLTDRGPSTAEIAAERGSRAFQDSAEQKRAQEALRHSEQRLVGIIASAMDAIITIDSNQRIVVFNKAAEQIFRCPASEALGQRINKFIPTRFRGAHQRHIHGFSNTGVTARSMYSPGTLFALRADGQEFPIEATISQVESEGEKLFTVILRDIGARLQMEAELRQAQKMEAVGQLAGGIAHEFNNFLGVVLGYSELLAAEAFDNERLARYVKEIREATQHASSLTRQLLAFSRKQVVQLQTLDLNRCIWEGHNLLRRLVPANIDVVPVLASSIGKVNADPGQIHQILINLVINACDAMLQGGRVVIETSDAEVEEEYATQHVGLNPGSYVVLSVSDTGSGMNSETRLHLFEPFYTTKEPGKGTGLGLSTVYGIVKHNGGHITVDSVEGKGTTFRIYFQRIRETDETAQPVCDRVVERTRTGSILVVEDESALRRLICTSLEKRKYNVFAARDGEEALEVFRRHAAQIQLVVTDLMMPRMDGFELKQHVVRLWPDAKFLFMSGYAQPIAEQHGESLKGCAFLEKPFLPEELVLKVSGMLAAEAVA